MVPLSYIKEKFQNRLYLYMNISKGKAADTMTLSESQILVELNGFMKKDPSSDVSTLKSSNSESKV